MKSVQFIISIHNHQPVGNFDFVFEQAYQRSYRPFVEVLEEHPTISMVLHFSGCLIEWLEDHHPDYLDRVGELINRGNVELLSGGFYEPILSVIPDHDKLGQIQKLNKYLRNRFGYEPTGLWLAERVWEPHLAKAIKEAGIEYTIVDDFHFLAGGKEIRDLTGYFITEEQGYNIGLFPIQQKLRYTMPFEEPEETIDLLRTYATESGENVITMADDGEKFGVWPGTYTRCYGKENWVKKFFRALEKNRDWLHTTTFKEYYKGFGPRGRVYLPDTSYFEMNEWTLPPGYGEQFSDLIDRLIHQGEIEQLKPFLRGGTWRNFLVLYDESNWMHKRVTSVSYQLANVRTPHSKKLEEAQRELWRSQCNCAYWHGIFGGLYLPHLRHAIYEHLLSAEKLLDREVGLDREAKDLDGDGATEYQLHSDKLRLIISERGGMIQEFDYLPKNFNILNTIRRYRESYHSKMGKAPVGKSVKGSIHQVIPAREPGLTKFLQYDPWPRKMLLDHFIPAGTRLTKMKKEIPDNGDFVNAIYESEFGGSLMFHRNGKAYHRKVGLQKEIWLKDSEVTVEIIITNEDEKVLPGLYACEMNFSMLGGHTPDRYYEINGRKTRPKFLDTSSDESDLHSIGIVSESDGFRTVVLFTEPTNLWRFPVETVSMSESGVERIYQSSAVVPYWKLSLRSGDLFRTRFTIRLEELR